MTMIIRSRVRPVFTGGLVAMAAVAGSGSSVLAGAPANAPYSFTPLGFLPGGLFSQASGISPDGSTVVGSGASLVGAEAFIWQAGFGLVPLPGVPAGNESSAFAVTNTAVVAGSQGGPGAERPTRWAAAINTFGTRPGEASDLTNDGGVLVGRIDGTLVNTSNAFYFTDQLGIINLPLGALNTAGSASAVSPNGDWTVGWRAANNNAARQPVIWTRSGTGNPTFTAASLPISVLASSAQATCISGDGNLIVGTENSTTGTRGVRWTRTGGSFTAQPLPALGGFASSALAVSQDGTVIVGTADRATGGSTATLWRGGQTIELQALLGNAVPAGWRLDVATDVSADGTAVVGFARDLSNRIQAFRATVTRPCGSSDIASPGQLGRPDGEVTADDLILFIARFTSRDVRGDIAGPGPTVGADGEFTADDIILFVSNFTSGC